MLDFAAGSGICALAAMKAGAAEAIAVDIDPYSVGGGGPQCRSKPGSGYRLAGDLLDDGPLQVDLLVAGDVCYEEPMAARVLPWLRNVQASGIRVLLADPGRTYFPEAEFLSLAEYDIPTSRDLEDAESKRTGVYAFRSAEPVSARPDALRS